MTATALLWPAIAQVALTGAVYGALGVARGRAIIERRVADTDFAPGTEPADSAAIRRHLANQFEMPILFFVVVGYLVTLGAATAFEVWVAWAFVVSRIAHTFGALRGPLRLRHATFTAGTLLVAALWASLAWRIW
ncbi:MAG: MAPEG family protein [Bauldia sp.]